MRLTVIFGLLGLTGAAFNAADPGVETQRASRQAEQIERVASVPHAPEQPRTAANCKVVFTVSAHEDPAAMPKGLERIARWVELHQSAGGQPQQLRVTAIFDGEATRAVLTHEAYSRHTREQENPCLRLLDELERLGFELLVCGQALEDEEFGRHEIAPQVGVATGAISVLIDRQQQGYAYLPF